MTRLSRDWVRVEDVVWLLCSEAVKHRDLGDGYGQGALQSLAIRVERDGIETAHRPTDHAFPAGSLVELPDGGIVIGVSVVRHTEGEG